MPECRVPTYRGTAASMKAGRAVRVCVLVAQELDAVGVGCTMEWAGMGGRGICGGLWLPLIRRARW